MPRFVPVEELFRGRHFDREIVVLCVRWYLSYKLSYRDLVAMMGERGIELAHTTILRWVQHNTFEFQKRWNRFARPLGGSWRIDETYIRFEGRVGVSLSGGRQGGQTVDFYLSHKRDVNAAKAFLRNAMRSQRIPLKITLDAYSASHRAIADLKAQGDLPKRVRVRTSKYLNNAIEQDHRRVKQRLGPMIGLKSFRTAAVVMPRPSRRPGASCGGKSRKRCWLNRYRLLSHSVVSWAFPSTCQTCGTPFSLRYR